MRIWFDTESIMFLGATMLIQYSTELDPENVIIHDVFDRPAIDTLKLIKFFSENTLVGYNLSHDAYHLARTFNCLAHLPADLPPDPWEYSKIERELKTKEYCIKPKGGCVDLMIVGRRDKLQSTMKQHPIIIRRVPRRLAPSIIKHLQRIEINPIHFAKVKEHKGWQIKDLNVETGEELTSNMIKMGAKPDPDLVNIRLNFHPSAKLKDVCKHLLGFKDTEEFELMGGKYKEKGWFPCSGEWISVFGEHHMLWRDHPKKRAYAKRDIVYTKAVDDWLGNPEPDEISMLAFMVGNTYWSGYAIDKEELEQQYMSNDKELSELMNEIKININSPIQVLKYLHAVCHPIEKLAVQSSGKDTLRLLCDAENEELAHRAQLVTKARDKSYELRLLEALRIAGRFYVTFNMSGTRTGRATGGDSVNSVKRNINPQGIKKSVIRKIFTFAEKNMVLSNGDFDGFEVSIYDAVYKDPKLHEELLTNKKIHAIWGSFLFNMTYEEVLATDGIKASEDNGFYQRAKNSFFAMLYGAQPDKVAEITRLDLDEVLRGFKNFEATYIEVGRSKERIKTNFSCIAQDKVGGKVRWVVPQTYIESFLKLKRDFAFEFDVIRQIFQIASELPEDIKQIGSKFGVMRKEDRVQTGAGATRSALFGACGNLMGKIQRIAGNFEIQSPGGEITKRLQARLTEFQPAGIHPFKLKLFNMHDELEAAHVPELTEPIKVAVNNFIQEYTSFVPLLAMSWQTNEPHWYGSKKLAKDKEKEKV